MFHKLFSFFLTGPSTQPLTDKNLIRKKYERARWSVFLSITLGYGLFYVGRLTLGVAKKPLIDAEIMNAYQLGLMGSAFYITYAVGKFLNGFLADRMNIKRFMSLGLMMLALVNLVLGFTTYFGIFVVLWAVNGWFQTLGSAPSVVSLSQWFSKRELGTRYGIWSTSHFLGEAATFLITAILVSKMGWRWGFWGPGIVCLIGGIAFYHFMYDRPLTYGLPAVADYKNDHSEIEQKETTTWQLQLEVLKNPYVWILGLSSAAMSICRYGVMSWGVFYLQTHKGYEMVMASSIVSANPLFGLLGTVLSGFVSDRFFSSKRNVPALIFGVVYVLAIVMFLLNPKGAPIIDAASMALFGFALGALLTYLGGLMAVDICSKRAAGAAMGFIGLFSYLAAGVQDWLVGFFINAGKIVENGTINYNFDFFRIFLITAAIVSILLPLLVWRAKIRE